MYQSHWGLRESPFHGATDAGRFSHSPTHEEAIARLQFLVDHRWRLGALVGESGSGKSLTLEVFASAIKRRGGRAAKLSLLGLEVEDLLWGMAAGLGLSPLRSDGPPLLWRKIEDDIVAGRFECLPTVVLLDDAHRATRAVLEQVTRLVHFKPAPAARLTVVVASPAGGLSRLGRTLLELTDLRTSLESWNREELGRYLRDTLTRSGGRGNAFSEPAIDRLQELSGGLPRRVNQLAELALIAGAGRELGQVDPETVESVFHELGFMDVSAQPA